MSGQKAASGRSWGGLGVGASERCHGAGGAEWGLAVERGLGSTRQRQSGVVGRLVWPGAKREPSRRASGLSPLRPCGWARPEASAVCAVGQAVPSLRHPSSHRGAQQLLCLVRAQIHLPPPPSHPLPVTNTPSLVLTQVQFIGVLLSLALWAALQLSLAHSPAVGPYLQGRPGLRV